VTRYLLRESHAFQWNAQLVALLSTWEEQWVERRIQIGVQNPELLEVTRRPAAKPGADVSRRKSVVSNPDGGNILLARLVYAMEVNAVALIVCQSGLVDRLIAVAEQDKSKLRQLKYWIRAHFLTKLLLPVFPPLLPTPSLP
jgi:hypothetical protein